MAEAFYGVPEDLAAECRKRLPEGIIEALDSFNEQRKAMLSHHREQTGQFNCAATMTMRTTVSSAGSPFLGECANANVVVLRNEHIAVIHHGCICLYTSLKYSCIRAAQKAQVCFHDFICLFDRD